MQQEDNNLEDDDSDQDEDMQDNDAGTPSATDDQDEVAAADEDIVEPNEVSNLHDSAPSGAPNADNVSGDSSSFSSSSGSSSSSDSGSDSGSDNNSDNNSDSDSDDENDDTPVPVEPVPASQNSAARAVAAVAVEPAEDTAAGHQRSRKRQRHDSAAAFLDLEAAHNGNISDNKVDSEAEAEEQRQLNAVMINDDDSGQSDVDEFASALENNRMLDERDNKRRRRN